MTTFTPPDGAKALLFDADGTLLDTWALHRTVWTELLSREGFTVTDDWWEAYAHEDLLTMVQGALPGADEVQADEMNDEGTKIYLESLHLVERIHPVTEIAQEFHGRLPLAVVTAGFRDVVVPTLEAVGIADLFTVVVTGDDVNQIKPAPDGYEKAAHLLGVRAIDCVAFEDSDSGLESAQRAGIGTLVDVRDW
jgi:HAD superfamily hydrolase (TIGR01509 family)